MLRKIAYAGIALAVLFSFGTIFLDGVSRHQECEEEYAREQTVNRSSGPSEIGETCTLRAIGGLTEGFAILMTALATVALAYYTLRLGEDGKEQGKRIERSIQEAARAATAMEALAMSAGNSTVLGRTRSAQQMRAYLHINVGEAFYQDSVFNFIARPQLVNYGHTPAHRVTYRAAADILPTTLSDDFKFPLGDRNDTMSMALGPHQTLVLGAGVTYRVPDAEVEDIKIGAGRSLYTWGIVSYDDAFGDHHETRYCQRIVWVPGKDGAILGTYPPRHNDAT